MVDKIVNPWRVPVAVADIPETGLHLVLDAPADVRAGIAELAGLRDLPRLSAVFDLARRGAGVHVAGQVSATVGQTCVVTLEPMESAIEEAVDLTFSEGTAVAKPAGSRKDPPEALVGGKLDLGAIATEFLMLGIDPYPRKVGAEFAQPAVEDGGNRPFAALEALKKRSGGGPS